MLKTQQMFRSEHLFNNKISLLFFFFITYKKIMRYSVQPRNQIFLNVYGFCLLLKLWAKVLVKS